MARVSLSGSTKLGCIATLSGGLDSSVALAMTRLLCPVVEAVTFDYGQKSAQREIEAATRLAARFGIPHRVIELPWLASEKCALTERKLAVPHLSEKDLGSSTVTEASARAVWVPNRNGVFLSVAAALAEQRGVNRVCVGFNEEEAQTFADNSAGFLKAFNGGLKYSTRTQVQIISPTLFMTKKQIVRQARALDIPLEDLWSCYEGGRRPCGKCESCARFIRAGGTLPSVNEAESFDYQGDQPSIH